MARFTKALRQQIVEEFARRHNGRFNPALFVEEVRRKGAEHPAHDWFEWNRDKAALAYQVEQAREFARDLRVVFQIEEVGRSKRIRVSMAMPLVLSPMDERSTGGGYVLTDPDDPAHLAEHCRQAATALRAWLGRYEAAVSHSGATPEAINRMVQQLEAAAPKQEPEAA
jgi:hypothetical protein